MPSLFTRIIEGEIPSHRVAESEEFYAFLDIAPLQIGHTLVIPRLQIKAVTQCRKVAVLVLGLEVNHAHIHLVPINAEGDIDLKKKLQPSQDQLADMAARLRAAALV